MTGQTAHVVDEVEKTLRDEAFNTTRIVNTPKTHCCDVIATSQDHSISLITKIVENIDTTEKEMMIEMLLLGYFLKATPILIGIYNRRNELEDNTVYFRLDGHIIAINLYTLIQIIKHNIHPLRIAKRGGYLYKIDGEELKQLREEQSFSRKTLSEKMRISTKTIAEYERKKSVYSQLHHVELLEDILSTEIKKPIHIFDLPKKTKQIIQNRPSAQSQHIEIAEEISEILSELGIFQFWTSNSPFDVFFLIPGYENNLQIISGVFSNIQEEDLNRLYNIAQMVKIRNKMGPVRAIVEEPQDVKECKKVGIIPIESKKLKTAKEAKEIVKILSIR
ncbi:MAG: hypothetical protein JW776_03305 [Candidatus Lokiarchaeota archaeon]|nr:hypothetical protein [Candidatus Lokiarchaeota archaeon]